MKYSDFIIINELGKGGNAKVYLVETPSHLKVALKKLHRINNKYEKYEKQ